MPDRTPADTFQETFLALWEAIDASFKRPNNLPGLILLYTTIEIFSSLVRKEGKHETDGREFQDWVSRYMLPDSTLDCTALELWGARCGLVHGLRSDSAKSRKGGAREIGYVSNDLGKREMNRILAGAGATRHVIVSTQELLVAFLDGCTRFTKAINADPELNRRVSAHVSQLVVMEPLQVEGAKSPKDS